MGLLRMAARTAVVAGTATAVSGRVQRRQAARWGQEDTERYEQEAPPPEPEEDPPGARCTVMSHGLRGVPRL